MFYIQHTIPYPLSSNLHLEEASAPPIFQIKLENQLRLYVPKLILSKIC